MKSRGAEEVHRMNGFSRMDAGVSLFVSRRRARKQGDKTDLAQYGFGEAWAVYA